MALQKKMKLTSLKFALIILAFAIIGRIVFEADAQTNTPTPGWFKIEKYVVFSSGDIGAWLTVERHNHRDDPKGFDPCFTNIVVDYKPVVTKLANGKFEITFVSDLPNPPP